MFDVLGGIGVSYALNDAFSVGAKLELAWTNLEPHEDASTGQIVTPQFRDEYVPVATLNAGGEW
jgi:hypothetical protein